MDDIRNQVWQQFPGTRREFDAIWDELGHQDRLDTTSPTAAEDIRYDAISALKVQRVLAPGDHPEPLKREERAFQEEIAVELDDYTRERQEVFTEVAAEMAATHPEVRRFRSGELGGRLLTREEAGEALFGKGDLRNELGEDPLPSLAKQLAKHYHWRDYDAAWFVLTGDAPPVRLLSGTISNTFGGNDHYPNTARITLTADPCVDAKTIEKLYRNAQRQLLGGDNRKLARRTLEAARFAAQRIREDSAESWQRRTDRWNRLFPHWPYKSRGGLRQAFEKFWHPGYVLARWKPYDPTPAQLSRKEHLQRKLEAMGTRKG